MKQAELNWDIAFLSSASTRVLSRLDEAAKKSLRKREVEVAHPQYHAGFFFFFLSS